MNYLQLFFEWSNWLWRSGLNHLWQGTLFFAIVVLALLFLRRATASARYLLLLAASIKFAVPSVVIILTFAAAGINLATLFNRSDASTPTKTLNYIAPAISPLVIPASYLPVSKPEQTADVSSKPPSQLNTGGIVALAGCFVWLFGAVSFFVIWLKRRHQLSLSIKSGHIVRAGREYDSLIRVKAWLGITRDIELIVTSDVKEPGVWRVFRPIVLLSDSISSQLSDEELDTLLMHEMGHVLRWDNLVSNLNMILCCIFWFNPIIWLVDRWLLKEREEACDEMVLRWTGTGEVYASSLKKIYRFCLISHVSGLSKAGGSKLKHRLERIGMNDGRKRFTPLHKLLVATVIFGSVILTVLAAMQPADAVVENTNSVLLQAAQGVKEQIATHRAAGCFDADLKKCVHPPTSAVAAASSLGEVVVKSDNNVPIQAGAPTIAQLNESPSTLPTNQPGPLTAAKTVSEPASNFQTAHAVGLNRFAGRYAVDPSIMENFVLDVSADDGQLWLKPSHANRRPLIAQSIVDYVDAQAPGTRISFKLDENGNVESLTLRGWGPTIIAPRLVLPAPSREGNIVFKLNDFPTAKIVAVAGTFNGWNQSQYLFERVGNEWLCKISLPPGKYQYKFIVDGNWLTDPTNPTVVRDRRGFDNSQLIVR